MQWVVEIDDSKATAPARNLAIALAAVNSELLGISKNIGIFDRIIGATNNRATSAEKAADRAAAAVEKEQNRIARAHEKTAAAIDRETDRQTEKAIRASEKRAAAAEREAQRVKRANSVADQYAKNYQFAQYGPRYDGVAAHRSDQRRASEIAAIISRRDRASAASNNAMLRDAYSQNSAFDQASGFGRRSAYGENAQRDQAHAAMLRDAYFQNAHFDQVRAAAARASGSGPSATQAQRRAEEKLVADNYAIIRRTEQANGQGGSFLTLRNFYIAQQVLRTLESAAESAGRAVAGFIEKAITNTTLHQAQINSLELLTKNRAAAEQYYKVLVKIADSGYLSRQETITSGKRFLGQGVNEATTSALLLSIGDLTAGKQGGAAKMAAAISNFFNGRGRLTQIYNASDGTLSEQSLRRSTAAALHISEAQAADRLKSKDEHTRYSALAAGIQESALGLDRQVSGPNRGLLGARSHAVGGASPGEQIGLLTEKFESLFQTVTQQPVTEFLRNLNNEFSETSSTVDVFKGIIESTFTNILTPWLNQYAGSEGLKRLHGDLLRVAGGIKTVGEVAAEASRDLNDLYRAAMLLSSVPGYVSDFVSTAFPTAGLALQAARLGQVAFESATGAGGPGTASAVPHAEGAIITKDHNARVHAGELYVNPRQTSEIVDRAMNGGGAGGSRTVNMGGINIVMHAGEGAAELAQRVVRMTIDELTTVFEQGAIALTGGT